MRNISRKAAATVLLLLAFSVFPVALRAQEKPVAEKGRIVMAIGANRLNPYCGFSSPSALTGERSIR
jgi:hypothetical protein